MVELIITGRNGIDRESIADYKLDAAWGADENDFELTVDRLIDRDGKLTALMITHNMRDAIQYGNRLIMLHDGHVILDIAGEEKKKLTVPDLLEQFTKASGDEFANDRAILS